MQSRTEHFLPLAALILLIAAVLLSLNSPAAQTNNAAAVCSIRGCARIVPHDLLLDDPEFLIGDQELNNQKCVGFAPGLEFITESLCAPDRGAQGFGFGKGFKTEIEKLNYDASVSNVTESPAGSVRMTALMFNGLYEFENSGWRLRPYIGVGFGVVDWSGRPPGIGENAFLTPQMKGGVNYNITQKLFGKFEYRWSQGARPGFGIQGVPAEIQLKRGGFRLGVNYHLQ
jgi:opacity protein-like surface antigen